MGRKRKGSGAACRELSGASSIIGSSWWPALLASDMLTDGEGGRGDGRVGGGREGAVEAPGRVLLTGGDFLV